MSLQPYIEKLKVILVDVEDNNVQVAEHGRNARIGNIGSVAAYLLTSNSESKTTRTLGQVGAIAGLIYSASERNKSNSYKKRSANKLLRSIPEIFSADLYSTFTSSTSDSVKREFLTCVLRFASHIDDLAFEKVRLIQNKHLFTTRNFSEVLNLTLIDIFSAKYQVLVFLNKIDRSIENNFYNDLNDELRQINISEFKREMNYHILMMALALSIGILGFLLSSQFIMVISFLLIIGIYVSSAYRSFFPQHQRLHSARRQFFQQLKINSKLSTIKYS